ncbi:MAG: hypothetical protein KKE17_04685 [Proteobacteria bacterium]|nr:hypothetical protein [Pseudomonadota bacterium]MBU1709284.1 hypothetical protein [Pseudomonadota bacterium]
MSTVYAKVTGQCSNCHSMHNSQNASTMVAIGTFGTYARWDGGRIQGGVTHTPQSTLLISDCVGCHSSSGNQTIISLGGTNVPIVFNQQEPSKTPLPGGTNQLAGGNFYWMVYGSGSQADKDGRGHNVYGISGIDSVLTANPGNPIGCGNANDCHESLAHKKEIGGPERENGCRACHTPDHHGADPSPGPQEDAGSGWYRFLKPQTHTSVSPGDVEPVTGVEDSLWERDAIVGGSNHNIYYAGDFEDPYIIPSTLGRFCAGCHQDFHAPGDYWGDWEPYSGSGENDSPWIRHPADARIRNIAGSEYGGANGVIGKSYDPLVPVGKILVGGSPGTVLENDTVMCVSCHRSHGSPYADMLRWDYSGMMSHTTGPSDTNGCFFCHREKDDS